jgi:hypothetical protein
MASNLVIFMGPNPTFLSWIHSLGTIRVARADWVSAKAEGGCYHLEEMLER